MIIWIISIFIILLVIYFLVGRKPKEFLGLKPLYSRIQEPYDPFSPNYVQKFYASKAAVGSHKEDVSTTAATTTNVVSPTTQYTSTAAATSAVTPMKASLSAFEGATKDHYQLKPDVKPIEKLRANQTDMLAKWKTENDCCLILSDIYGKPFKTTRPNWLKNPETNGVLELDCYNEELKIAAEYNGIQHYVYPNPFHKTYDEFISLVRRDQYKVKQCDKNGVYLISIPYNIPKAKLKEFITHYLPENKKPKCKGGSKICMA
jgi:hypothetical protein